MINVSFDCENHNHALLLTTLYDVLTVEEVGDSISMIDFTGWLVDEIGRRLPEIDQFDVREGEHRLTGSVLEVAKIYDPIRPIKD